MTTTATRSPSRPSRRRWGRPDSMPSSSARRASTARSRSGRSASARAPRPSSTRRTESAPRPATGICTPRRSTRGRAPGPRPATGTSRSAATRASRRSTPTTATPTTRGCGWRSSTATPATRRGRPRSWPTRYPQGDLLNEALWRLAFAAWRGGRLDEALHWLDENLRLVPHEEIWYAEGRALYWKGRVLEKQGHDDDARAFYTRAVREYPLSVYALLALGRLKSSDPHAEEALVVSLRKGLKEIPAWSFPPRALYAEPGFVRAVALARMGQGVDARRELAKLGLATSADKHATSAAAATARAEGEDVLWITATLLDRGGVWSASHSLPRYGVTSYKLEYPSGLGAAKWKLAYPRAFPQLVAKNTKANQLPEA